LPLPSGTGITKRVRSTVGSWKQSGFCVMTPARYATPWEVHQTRPQGAASVTCGHPLMSGGTFHSLTAVSYPSALLAVARSRRLRNEGVAAEPELPAHRRRSEARARRLTSDRPEPALPSLYGCDPKRAIWEGVDWGLCTDFARGRRPRPSIDGGPLGACCDCAGGSLKR
jgi:hypothetical protein